MTKPVPEVSRLSDTNALPEVHDLEAHMHLLRRVDAIRKQSAALRTDGLKALFGLCEEPASREAAAAQASKSDVQRPDLNERYKQLRVMWQYSGDRPATREKVRRDIEEEHGLFPPAQMTDEPCPVLAAAEAMRTFACVGKLAGTHQMMQAWYRIIRELFTAAKPDWLIGGARAGDGGWVTAYCTAQCVQAICDLARVLERTAELMVSMHRFNEQLKYRNGGADATEIDGAIPDKWIECDKQRVLADLSVTIRSMSDATLLDLPAPDAGLKKLDGYVRNDFEQAVAKMLWGLHAAFVDAQKVIGKHRKNEETKAERLRAAYEKDPKKRDPKARATTRGLDESKTGHAIALRAISIGADNAREALEAIYGKNFTDDVPRAERNLQPDWMLLVADSLRVSARGVRSGAETCRGYLSSVIDRQILASEPTDNRSWEPDELSFALSAYILSSEKERIKAEMARLRNGTRLIWKDLSSDGTISNRIPYHEVKGIQYYSNTEELLGAVADVVRLTGYPIEERLVTSMYHYFDRQCQRNVQSEARKNEPTVRGWFSEFDHHKNKVSLRATTDAVESLGAFNRMLDEGINEMILDHFNVKQPNPNGLTLDGLFYPDYGFGRPLNSTDDPRIARDSIALTMQKMRAHVLRTSGDTLHSLVLHGPGGTGKTTLIEALANTCRVPLVEVTPSDIVERGEAAVERRARAVFEALSMLSKVVILFDEFDPVLKRRASDGNTETNIYTFLTPGMLPKLKALNESAKNRRVAYALMTNLIGSLDEPAVRKGRFDEAVGIYPPDPLSRAGYMARLCIRYVEARIAEHKEAPQNNVWRFEAFDQEAFMNVVSGTAGIGMTPVTAKGCFRVNDDSDLSKAPIGYIFGCSDVKPKFDDPEQTYTGPKGKGQFAAREALQWGWLDQWDKASTLSDVRADWRGYLENWPFEKAAPPSNAPSEPDAPAS